MRVFLVAVVLFTGWVWAFEPAPDLTIREMWAQSQAGLQEALADVPTLYSPEGEAR